MLEREVREVKIGGIYRHFKGHFYKVIGIAKDSETLEDKIVYQNVDSGELWIRDVFDFLSIVDKKKYPEVKQFYRFELLDK